MKQSHLLNVGNLWGHDIPIVVMGGDAHQAHCASALGKHCVLITAYTMYAMRKGGSRPCCGYWVVLYVCIPCVHVVGL